MSINHDIRPKRVYRIPRTHSQGHHHIKRLDFVDQQEDFKEKHQDDEILGRERLEEEFFSNKEIPNKKIEKVSREGRLSRIFKFLSIKKLISVFAILLIIIVLYQNYSDIKTSLKDEKNKINGTSNTKTAAGDDYYNGEKDSNTSENKTDQSVSSTEASQTPSSTEANSTAETQVATTNKADLNIKVLNGNGTAGTAEKTKQALETAGYKVSKVANAKTFSYKTSYIYFKNGKDSQANEIKSLLSNLSITLEKSDSIVGNYDIVVVVGKS